MNAIVLEEEDFKGTKKRKVLRRLRLLDKIYEKLNA